MVAVAANSEAGGSAPEPAALALLGGGLISVAVVIRRLRRGNLIYPPSGNVRKQNVPVKENKTVQFGLKSARGTATSSVSPGPVLLEKRERACR